MGAILVSWTLAFTGGATGCAFELEPGVIEDQSMSGAVDLALTLADGLEIDAVAYAITGNGLDRRGTIDVRGSTRIAAVLGGIPAGIGYSIRLDALGLEGVRCAGSSSFDVVASETTSIEVSLTCHLPRRTGTIIVDGELNVCPFVENVTPAMARPIVGQPIAITARATDVDAAPSPLTYAWTSTRGTLVGQGSDATFTCDETGAVIVWLTVFDGDCTDQLAVTLTCVR